MIHLLWIVLAQIYARMITIGISARDAVAPWKR